ncbi:LAMI_0F11012g1_1 [Lachancea mirantina]|uniref:LAMI_0F11012g1_1 n=1 Tax=Lachancea mirantina TaxID=1230905 RepID=A0A1G4K2G6_9SACH|nr:LAMI_0F11012g1_1 [Lachancea mirantina]
MIVAVFIADSRQELVFQYLVSSDLPGYKSLRNRIQTMAPTLAAEPQAGKASVGRSMEVYKHVSPNGLAFWCATKPGPTTPGAKHPGVGHPAEPLVFLQTLETLLLHYFDKDQLSVAKIRNNYDRVTMLVYSMLDAGEPANVDLGRLQEMVPLRRDLAKVVNATASSLGKRLTQGDSHALFALPNVQGVSLPTEKSVPWRTAGLVFADNELYVDATETVNAVFRRSTHGARDRTRCVSAFLEGTIDFNSHLTGDPTVLVRLDLSGHKLAVPALHRCVDTQGTDFHASRLRFVPPDGKFRLMRYVVDLTPGTAPASHQHSRALANLGLVVPELQSALGANRDEFEVTLDIAPSTTVSAVDNVQVALHFPQLPSGARVKALRTTHGRFENSVDNRDALWLLDKTTSTGTRPVLRACIENSADDTTTTTTTATTLRVSYAHKGLLPSGIKVDAVDIVAGLPSTIKPFKGVKYLVKTGDFVLR